MIKLLIDQIISRFINPNMKRTYKTPNAWPLDNDFTNTKSNFFVFEVFFIYCASTS